MLDILDTQSVNSDSATTKPKKKKGTTTTTTKSKKVRFDEDHVFTNESSFVHFIGRNNSDNSRQNENEN